MKKVIQIKKFPEVIESVAKMLEVNFSGSLALSSPSTLTLGLLCSDSWTLACCHAYLGEGMPTVGRYLSGLAEATTLLFRSGFAVAGPRATLEFLHEVPERPIGAGSMTHPSAWLDGVYAAVVLRRVDILNELCAISSGSLRSSTTESEDYTYFLMDLIQALLFHKPNAQRLFAETLKATDPATLKSGSPDWTLSLVVPALEVMHRLMTRDAAAFNDALYRALTMHKDYWRRRKNDAGIDGLLSLPLLALVALGLDWEMPVEVDSGYIPLRIYDPNEWPKKANASD